MNTTIQQLPPSGTVKTNGQELYYEIHGEGPALVLVMGIGYDSSLWTLAQVPALSTQFRVVLVDNRDAGRSSRASHPYSIADMADDLAGLLDALGIPRTHLLGLSMGGMIALEFALRHADRLDRLVLSGTGAAPARSAVDPIEIWSWVKANDAPGRCSVGSSSRPCSPQPSFGTTKRCRTPPSCWQAIRTRSVPRRTRDRRMRTCSSMPSIGWAQSPLRRSSSWGAGPADATLDSPRGCRRDPRRTVRGHPRRRVVTRGADRTPRRLQPPRLGLSHRIARRASAVLRRGCRGVPHRCGSG